MSFSNSDEPGCDYWYTPKCARGHGSSHVPDPKTKRRTPCASAVTYWVNCARCRLDGLVEADGSVRWEQPGHHPD